MNSLFKTLTVTEAKKKFLELVEDIEKLKETVTITKNGIPTTVMMSLEDYESLIETLEILANPKIMKALRKSKEDIRKGRLFDDDEVWA